MTKQLIIFTFLELNMESYHLNSVATKSVSEILIKLNNIWTVYKTRKDLK